MKKIEGLSVFPSVKIFTPEVVYAALRRPIITKVVCCALGPKGNNIEQAATRWLERMGVKSKSEVILRDTPELCLELARSITEDGVIAVFWTCAVYAKENQFFFGNPDVLPFFFQEEMLLDEMQLATRPDLVNQANDMPSFWEIGSHPSPAPLVKGLGRKVVLQNSNAAAAKACAEGETQLCITTESARRIYNLVQLHSFGSPNMVFFGGVTQHGFMQVDKAIDDLLAAIH